MKALLNEKPRERKSRRTARARPPAAGIRRPVAPPAEERQVAEMIRTFTVRWEW